MFGLIAALGSTLIGGASAAVSGAGALLSGAASTIGSIGSGALSATGGALSATSTVGGGVLKTAGSLAAGTVKTLGGVAAAAPKTITTLADILPQLGGAYQQIQTLFGKKEEPVSMVTPTPTTSTMPTLPNILIQPTAAQPQAQPQGAAPVIISAGQAQAQPNYVLLIALGIVAYVLLKKK